MHVILAALDAALTQAGKCKLKDSETLGVGRDDLVPSPLLYVVLLLLLFGDILCFYSKILSLARVKELLSASDVNKVILAMGEAWMFLLIESRSMHQ